MIATLRSSSKGEKKRGTAKHKKVVQCQIPQEKGWNHPMFMIKYTSKQPLSTIIFARKWNHPMFMIIYTSKPPLSTMIFAQRLLLDEEFLLFFLLTQVIVSRMHEVS